LKVGKEDVHDNDFTGLRRTIRLNPDPVFLLTQNHKRILINGLWITKGGFILLTGKGDGKTAFIQQLLQTLDPNIKAISIFQPESFDQLLEIILRSLKLPVGKKKSFL
jgi:hypothetical protein